MDVGAPADAGVRTSQQVARLTDGIGADGVIITAATPSDAVVSTAFRMCRRKGRVVLVGDVGLDLDRADFYQKELDFFISTLVRPGPLRPELRGARPRLSGRLRPLDREPQHGGVPAPGRRRARPRSSR